MLDGLRLHGFYEGPLTGSEVTGPAPRLADFAAWARAVMAPLFNRGWPTPAEVAFATAQSRILRWAALDRGLDPDRVTPEDAMLLLERNDKGEPMVFSDYNRSAARLGAE